MRLIHDTPLALASKSAARRYNLQAAGLDFVVVVDAPAQNNSSLTFRPNISAALCNVTSVTLPSFGSSSRPI